MKKRDLNNIDYYFIENNKFKTNTIRLCFKEKTNEENVIKRQALPKILLDKTQKFDDKLKLRRHLNLLYSTSLSIKETIVGEYSLLSFSLTYIQGKYLDEDITSEILDLLKEVIYNPYLVDNKFDEDTIKRVKNQFLNLLKQKEQSFPLKTKEQAMIATFENQPINKTIITKEKVSSLDNQKLYDYYQEILNTNEMLLIFEGDKDIYEQLDFRSNVVNKNEYIVPVVKAKEVGLKVVKDKTKQNNICLIFDNFSNDKKDIFKNLLFSMLLGDGASSLLFQEIREKHSLAYSISSGYDSQNNIMMINGGVKLNSLDKTIELINEIFETIKNGDITTYFNDAKLSYINALNSYLDIKNALSVRVATQWIQNNFRSIDESIVEVEKVTIEDMKEIANKIKLKTTYVLQGEIK